MRGIKRRFEAVRGLAGPRVKRLLAVAAVAVLTFAPAAGGARFVGYLPPDYRPWIADAATRMPMPRGRIAINRGDCASLGTTCFVSKSGCTLEGCYSERTIYTAEDIGWSQVQRRFILLHEIGHAVDFTRLDKRDRRTFRGLLRLKCGWLDESRAGCDPIPAERWAEQYAACAAGVSRPGIHDAFAQGVGDRSLADAYFYEYVTPSWLSESLLCDWMRRVTTHRD